MAVRRCGEKDRIALPRKRREKIYSFLKTEKRMSGEGGCVPEISSPEEIASNRGFRSYETPARRSAEKSTPNCLAATACTGSLAQLTTQIFQALTGASSPATASAPSSRACPAIVIAPPIGEAGGAASIACAAIGCRQKLPAKNASVRTRLPAVVCRMHLIAPPVYTVSLSLSTQHQFRIRYDKRQAWCHGNA